MQQVGLGLRMGAGVIDLVGVVIVACLLTPLMKGSGRVVVHDPIESGLAHAPGVPLGVLVWSLSFLLMAILEGVSGRSLGKRVLSLTVVPRVGSNFQRVRLATRSLLKFTFAICGVVLFVFSNPSLFTLCWAAAAIVFVTTCLFVPLGRNPIHDFLAGTFVVRES